MKNVEDLGTVEVIIDRSDRIKEYGVVAKYPIRRIELITPESHGAPERCVIVDLGKKSHFALSKLQLDKLNEVMKSE